MNPMIQETRSPPVCERCKLPLSDGDDPLRRSLGPIGRRHSGEFHPPSPLRVVKPGPDGERVTWWCSSKCFKLARQQKPTKKGNGRKPTPDQQFHIRPRAA